MKLNLKQANIHSVPAFCRNMLKLSGKPFCFVVDNHTVYMNEDMENVEQTQEAIEEMWRNGLVDFTDSSSEAVSAAFDVIVKLQGEEAASQLNDIWTREMQMCSQRQSTKEARRWIEQTYENLTDAQTEALREAGYKSRIVEEGMWRAMREIRNERGTKSPFATSSTADAAGVYGFLLGMEYGKKASNREMEA